MAGKRGSSGDRQAERGESGRPGKAPRAAPSRGRIAPALGLAALAVALAGPAGAGPARAASAAPGEAPQAESRGADSLRALRLLLSSEVKGGNRVLVLKDPRLSDSLVRNPPARETFLRSLGDSAVARSIRDPEEFRAYWDRLEARNGIRDVKGQMAAQDIDKSRIPKAYLFDSSVVVYPGWIIVRRARHR